MTSINIGFDFDGVITDGYSILPITLLLEGFIADEIKKSVVPVPKDIKDALSMYKERFYNRVAANEVATGGTLLRPSLLKILPELLKQRREGKISTLFIYSNNENYQLINAVDHILALTLTKLSVPVAKDNLIQELTGLQVMEPRIHRNSPCRSSEKIQGDHYKEKTFQGIENCLGKAITPAELWFLDDTKDHIDLIQNLGLGERYIETKKYDIKLKNPKIAEMMILSYPKECFDTKTVIGTIFMNAYKRVESVFINTPANERYLIKENPRFNPVGTENEKKRVELMSRSLNAVSPNISRTKAAWTAKETETDTDILRKRLNIDFNRPRYVKQVVETSDTALATPYYGHAMEGGSKKKMNNSRITRRRTRKVRAAK